MSDLIQLIHEQGDAIASWKSRESARIDALEMKLNRPGFATSNLGTAAESKRLHDAVRNAFRGDDAEIKAMSAGIDTEGGYTVIPQFDSQIRLIREQVSPLSSLAREVVLSSGSAMELPRAVGTLPSAWVSEVGSRTETETVAMALDRIELHEHYCMPRVTQRLLDDSNYDIGGFLVDQISHGLAVNEAIALHTGTGAGQPRGFTTFPTAATSDATRPWGTIEHVGTGTSGAFAANAPADVLFDVISALQPQYRANARWVMSRATHNVIRKFKSGATSEYLLRPGIAEGEPDRLLGFPVVISEHVPAIAASSLSVWFGDWREAYCIVRRPGVRLLRDPYTSKGSVNFYSYARVGGGVVNTEAIKAVRFA